MKIIELAGSDWSLQSISTPHSTAVVPTRIAGATIAANVPGCVHTDLLTARLIDDPYIADNELKQFWIGSAGWRYEKAFEVDAALLGQEQIDLACDGLDTVATIYINGTEIGRGEDQHLRYRFDIKSALQAGKNTIAIVFDAPLPYAQAMRKRLGAQPINAGANRLRHPYNFIRKMACNFGWDWGPEVITSGIWRDIRIEVWDDARLGDIRPLITKADADLAIIDLRVDLQGVGEVHYDLCDTAEKKIASGTCTQSGDEARAMIEIANPQLWWPVGYGDQILYTLRVSLGDQVKTHRIGLRTIQIVTEIDTAPQPHGQGSGMYFRVNGQRIYAKGANWIPDDCFLPRVNRSRYRHRLLQARDANMNMLRVWGGGIFEDDIFYDLCDELGILVWQDALTACAGYSEQEPIYSLFEAETRDNLSRLARHPSLCVMNGCNENLWGWRDWDFEGKRWPEAIGGKGWGSKYYFELFPKLVSEIAPTLSYWPGSPSNGTDDIDARHPNLNEFGNRHVWDVWHGRGQYRNYLEHFPRFCSEFGFHGPPCYPTLDRTIPEKDRVWSSPMMKLHNKNGGDGQLQTNTRMADDFDPPDDFDDWLYLAQVMQARALTMGVEWFRALSPWCSGALFWQLNDCWPVSSWSAIDGDGRPKPLYYASRHFFSPRLVTIKPRKVVPVDQPIGLLAVYLHNDHAEMWKGMLHVRHMDLSGKELNRASMEVDIEARGSAKIDIPDAWHDAAAGTFVVADLDDSRGYWWFEPDKQMRYPNPRIETTLKPALGGYRLTITALTLLRDICVFADRIDPQALCSDQFFTLLPGESKQLVIQSKANLTIEQLRSPRVLRCVNLLGRG